MWRCITAVPLEKKIKSQIILDVDRLGHIEMMTGLSHPQNHHKAQTQSVIPGRDWSLSSQTQDASCPLYRKSPSSFRSGPDVSWPQHQSFLRWCAQSERGYMMLSSPASELLLLLAWIYPAHGLYFHIGETEKKCFIEEIPDETMVIGELLARRGWLASRANSCRDAALKRTGCCKNSKLLFRLGSWACT